MALVDRRLASLLAEQVRGDLAVEDHSAVAPERLCREDGAVGAGEELLGGAAVLGVARDTDRDRQPRLGERLAHLAAKAIGEDVRAVLIRVGREQSELLAADTSRDVDTPLALLHQRGDRLESPLRRSVAVLLVEVLEAV